MCKMPQLKQHSNRFYTIHDCAKLLMSRVFLGIKMIIALLKVLKLNFDPIVNRQIRFVLLARDPFVSYIGAGTWPEYHDTFCAFPTTPFTKGVNNDITSWWRYPILSRWAKGDDNP